MSRRLSPAPVVRLCGAELLLLVAVALLFTSADRPLVQPVRAHQRFSSQGLTSVLSRGIQYATRGSSSGVSSGGGVGGESPGAGGSSGAGSATARSPASAPAPPPPAPPARLSPPVVAPPANRTPAAAVRVVSAPPPPPGGSGETYIRLPARRNVPLWSALVNWLKRTDYPQQVHLAMAGRNSVRVMWLTTKRLSPSIVQYGEQPGQYEHAILGKLRQYRFVLYWSGFLHSVTLGDVEGPLKPDTTYYYRLGMTGVERSFKTPPDATAAPMSVVLAGDLGQTEWTLSTLKHVSETPHDMVIIPGDLSYADFNPWRWDMWHALIEPYASVRPWMSVPGNHEKESLTGVINPFLSYNARWQMPAAASGSKNNLYYSFETAGVHWLMLSSYSKFDSDSKQYEWLKNDLDSVNRTRTPWLVAVLHAPWYSSNAKHQTDGQPMRDAMEKLLYKARTDVLFAGHVHAYERTVRVYKEKIHPCGIVHITIGDGGNREGLYSTFDAKPDWSAFREASFGHGRLDLRGGAETGVADWHWLRNQDDVSTPADSATIFSLASSFAPKKCRAD